MSGSSCSDTSQMVAVWSAIVTNHAVWWLSYFGAAGGE